MKLKKFIITAICFVIIGDLVIWATLDSVNADIFERIVFMLLTTILSFVPSLIMLETDNSNEEKTNLINLNINWTKPLHESRKSGIEYLPDIETEFDKYIREAIVATVVYSVINCIRSHKENKFDEVTTA